MRPNIYIKGNKHFRIGSITVQVCTYRTLQPVWRIIGVTLVQVPKQTGTWQYLTSMGIDLGLGIGEAGTRLHPL